MKKDYFYIKGKIHKAYYKLISKFIYSHFFYSFGKNSKIIHPLIVSNSSNIIIGDNVTINDSVFLWSAHTEKKRPLLSIGAGCVIGNFNHITALSNVTIEEDVLTADHVYISDNYHDFVDVENPILVQNIRSKGATFIGRGSWIGENACIISAHIGRHCIIAANSVVNTDLPDYCMVAGVPATIKKIYDFSKQSWVKYEKK